MIKVVYITGNPHKAEYFSKIMGQDIDHMKVDVDEIQSLDLTEIVTHKVKQAYELVQGPVLIEDTKLTFNALNGLPGPLIKWFLEQLGAEGLCKILDPFDDRSAVAGAAAAYYDGHLLEVFTKEHAGKIALKPDGTDGFGWNRVFIPEGSDKTLAQMDEETFKSYYNKIKPFDELKAFLESNR